MVASLVNGRKQHNFAGRPVSCVTVLTTVVHLPRCILGCQPAGGCWHEGAALRSLGLGLLYLQSPPAESQHKIEQNHLDCVVETLHIGSNKVAECRSVKCPAHYMCKLNVFH